MHTFQAQGKCTCVKCFIIVIQSLGHNNSNLPGILSAWTQKANVLELEEAQCLNYSEHLDTVLSVSPYMNVLFLF